MTDQSTINQTLKFKGFDSDEWRPLKAYGEDSDQKNKVRAAHENLKDILLASMQMQNLVVLAGSGTSLGPAGGPSMGELWNATVGKEPTDEAKHSAATVNHDLAIKNIEEFLSRCEAYLQIKSDKSIGDFLNSCKATILKKCSEFINRDKLDAHRIFIQRLSRRRVRDLRLKVFTTNYDLCFEHAAGDLSRVIIDGFSFSAPRHFDPRYFSYDIIRRPTSGEGQGNYLEGVFLLHKLHGSVNWARSVDGLIQEKENPSADEACIIYPAKGKYQQSFLQPHLESMSQFLAALREPNTCVIVMGFGFNDDHLSEPLLGAVHSNPHLRLIVVDPKAEDKEKEKRENNRYWYDLFAHARDGGDICFINSCFHDFVKLIPDLKSLTPADRLLKTIKGITEKK